ncbi:MAG: protein kinase family protein with domain protein [Gemmatimonadetes bacterium]|nr:protein kinase family protein with domain protein [Gemmatimonadota bacterium]
MTGFESLLAGRTLGGRYRIEALIGRGGMGAVYRATDERLGRPVAVKVISPPGGVPAAVRQELRTRFQREARAAARLHHPNVVTIHDFGTDAELDLDFLVMGLLDGEDLATRMARPEPVTPPEAAAILHGAARGLAAGHRAGLVHRDVKPGNLFLSTAGDGGGIEVRVLDFGIVKAAADEGTVTHLTRFGHAPHSPAYAAPEQLRGDPNPGPPCDVYGLGAIGWELLAGARPYTEAQLRRIGDGHDEPPPTPEPGGTLDGLLGAVLLRALSMDPARRPRDAAAFADELEGALAGRMPAPVPPSVRSAPPAVVGSASAEAGDRKPGSPGRALVAARKGGGDTVLAPPAGTDAARPVLIPCPECGQMVSRQAPACPRCGMPLGRRKRRGGGIVIGFLVGGLVAGGAALAMARDGTLSALGSGAAPADTGAPALDTARVVVPRKPVHVPAPRWKVVAVESDEGCSKLFDTCVRVRCTVANTGDAEGEAEFVVRLAGDREYERTRAVRVDAGGSEMLYFDFPEVHNGERFDQVTCRRVDRSAGGGGQDQAEGGGEAPPDARFGAPRDTLVM